jgi:hypothetical protein
MPLYGSAAPNALYNGDSVNLATAESPTSGQFSQAFTIAPSPLQNAPYSLSIQGKFSGAPGAFSYQMQESDTLDTAAFVNIGSAITAVNSGQVFRADFTAQAGRFYRMSYATQAGNAVTLDLDAHRP